MGETLLYCDGMTIDDFLQAAYCKLYKSLDVGRSVSLSVCYLCCSVKRKIDPKLVFFRKTETDLKENRYFLVLLSYDTYG